MNKQYLILFFILAALRVVGQQTTFDLQIPRSTANMIEMNGNLYFAGGDSDVVEVYNIANDSWTLDTMSMKLQHLFFGRVGDEIFAAGYRNSSPFYGQRMLSYSEEYDYWKRVDFEKVGRSYDMSVTNSKVVIRGGTYCDIYDPSTQSYQSIPIPIEDEPQKMIACHGKIYFAGGELGFNEFIADVYVYDMETWDIDTISLSEARSFVTCECSGDKVAFIGGYKGSGDYSTVVDIYDNSTNEWLSLNLENDVKEFATTISENYLYVAGGAIVFTEQASIEIIDLNTGDKYFRELSFPKSNLGAAFYDGKAYFIGGKDEDYQNTTLVEVFDEQEIITSTKQINKEGPYLSPNPASSYFQIQGISNESIAFSIHDIYGNTITNGRTSGLVDISDLRSGMYFINLTDGNNVISFIKF